MGSSPRRAAVTIVLALSTAVVLAGCGPASGGQGQRSGTVIDDGTEVRLCSAVLESYPPQCGDGVTLDGWDWDHVTGSREASGVRWGDYTVVGTLDGEVFVVAGSPTPFAP